jgi:hypothetical protein
MSNFVKSKNQLWKQSGTSLNFKDWLEREATKGTIPPKEHLLNVDGNDNSLDTTKLEDSLAINNTDKFEKILGIYNSNEPIAKDKNKILGLNKWVLFSSTILIAGAVAYKFYTKKK